MERTVQTISLKVIRNKVNSALISIALGERRAAGLALEEALLQLDDILQ